mmetsp:Transcript_9704/g.11966  ORF Transcript_9704/g.11966 Transcript_9704/m.11966 type:complete len:212 (-) Transcript_9704:2-637(-)
MNDRERDAKLGGQLATGLFLIGGPISIILGALGDVYSRKNLFVVVLVIGGLASVGTSMSKNFSQLFWSRSFTGISLGAALPLTFSLLGDLYPPSQRTELSARVGIALSAGQGAGQLFSGIVGDKTNWRYPFVIVAIAFFILALIVFCFMIEPPRGNFDPRSDKDQMLLPEKLLQDDDSVPLSHDRDTCSSRCLGLASTPTVWLIFLQGVYY